jgi:hypothetical protein
MFDFILNFTRTILFIFLFILCIPDFFFQLPKDGSKYVVAAVHGAIYAAAFTLLEIIFNMKRIYLCAKSLGTASV